MKTSDWLVSSPLPMGNSRIRNYEKRHEGRGIGTIDTRNEQSVERKALVCDSRHSEHSILNHSDFQVQSQDRKEERKKATRIPDTLICQLSISSTRSASPSSILPYFMHSTIGLSSQEMPTQVSRATTAILLLAYSKNEHHYESSYKRVSPASKRMVFQRRVRRIVKRMTKE